MKIECLTNVDANYLNGKFYIKNIDFLSIREIEFVWNACNKNIETLIKWFDTIGIKYNSIGVYGNNITYSIDGEELLLSSLSSGERMLLFLLACKEVNKPVVVIGLLENLDDDHAKIFQDNLLNFNGLTILTLDYGFYLMYTKLLGGVSNNEK